MFQCTKWDFTDSVCLLLLVGTEFGMPRWRRALVAGIALSVLPQKQRSEKLHTTFLPKVLNCEHYFWRMQPISQVLTMLWGTYVQQVLCFPSSPKTRQFSSTTIESVSSRENGDSWEVQDSMGQLSLQASLREFISAWWPIQRIWTFWGCLCSFLCLAFPITGILKDYNMDVTRAVV